MTKQDTALLAAAATAARSLPPAASPTENRMDRAQLPDLSREAPRPDPKRTRLVRQ